MKQRTIVTILLAFLVVMGAYATLPAAPEVGAQVSVPCYMEQGGAKFVASSGCEIEVQSGGTFDLQSGATIDFSSGVDLDGADLTIDADGDSILDENTDDAIRMTLGAATGTFSVLTGNLKVGNGTPTVTQDGEDAYIEGQLEVDGEAQFDGSVDSNGLVDIDGAADAVQLGVTGYATQTTDLAQFDGGLVDIGGGTYSTADGDNDLGVAGDLEVTGAIDANGAVDIAGNITDADSAVTFGDNVAVTGAADAIQLVISGYTTQTNSLLVLEQSDGTDVATVSNDGNVDVAGGVNYGSDNLYPLGYASADKQIVCGTSAEFTGTLEIEATGLTAIDYVLATQITQPAAGAAFLTVSDPTTSTFMIYTWESDYSEGTTPATAHWCAVGDQ